METDAQSLLLLILLAKGEIYFTQDELEEAVAKLQSDVEYQASLTYNQDSGMATARALTLPMGE